MTDTETVTLTIPRKTPYYSVARLVVGGMAAPLEMSYDALDDLQLAIVSLLDRDDLPTVQGDDLELRIEVSSDSMQATLGRFVSSSLDGAFENSRQQMTDAGGDGAANALDLRGLLDTIVDGVDVESSPDGEWVTLTKRVKAAAV